MRFLLFLLVFVLLLPSGALAWKGLVLHVASGDSLIVTRPGSDEQIKVRLYGIDCPEMDQTFGKEAKEFTREQTIQGEVEIDPVTEYAPDRLSAMVYVDKDDLSATLVMGGMAWVYQKYCAIPDCEDWIALEEAARQARVGLWSSGPPTPPWEWRRSKRK